MSVTKEKFGKLCDGRETFLYTIGTASGMRVEILDFGARLVSVYVPDKNGNLRDVVLGYDDAAGYEKDTAFFGAAVGPCANRIAKGKFTLDGKDYQLEINDRTNTCHSGTRNFGCLLWDAEVTGDDTVRFTIGSSPADCGFPGNVRTEVSYSFTDEGKLTIVYKGISDERTLFNPTNHSYFDLDGEGSGTASDAVLTINAKEFTVIDGELIPTGEIRKVKGTALDFTEGKPIKRDILSQEEQMLLTGGGYDHNFMTEGYGSGIRKIARAVSPNSGIEMDVYTDLPGVQLYTATCLEETKGKKGHTYGKYDGFCLETGFAPDAVNQPDFEKPVIEKNTLRTTVTIYDFSIS